MLFYNNRIRTRLTTDTVWFKPIQYRTNISQSRTIGFEMMIEADWLKLLSINDNENKLSTFINFSYNNANYINSDILAFKNKKVELVPPIVLKTGFSFTKEKYSLSYQFSYTKEHFSDATNSENQVSNAVVGLIYSYFTMDLSCKMIFKSIQLETGINNLSNEIYFTRRATGYPGPGIIPSMPRSFYICLQILILC